MLTGDVGPVAKMTDDTTHQDAVTAWLHRAPGEPRALREAFEAAFVTLWNRTRLTIGDVTLTAITERVLHVARARFPVLASLELGDRGLHWSAPPQPYAVGDHLADAIRFVLVEFLTVLGNLTAEILTPALHAELSRSSSPTFDSEDDRS